MPHKKYSKKKYSKKKYSKKRKSGLSKKISKYTKGLSLSKLLKRAKSNKSKTSVTINGKKYKPTKTRGGVLRWNIVY